MVVDSVAHNPMFDLFGTEALNIHRYTHDHRTIRVSSSYILVKKYLLVDNIKALVEEDPQKTG